MIVKIKKGRIMLSKYIVCDFGSNKCKFIKQKEPYELLNSLEFKITTTKVPVQVIFCFQDITGKKK